MGIIALSLFQVTRFYLLFDYFSFDGVSLSHYVIGIFFFLLWKENHNWYIIRKMGSLGKFGPEISPDRKLRLSNRQIENVRITLPNTGQAEWGSS